MLQLLATTFQKNSLGWQFQKFSQRVGEWILLQVSRWQPDPLDIPNLPDWAFPSWWLEALFWLIVTILVVVCGWQIYRVLMTYWPTMAWTNVMVRDRDQSVSHHRSVAEWLKAAQNFQQQRNYGDACRALYMAMIERLQETQLVPNDESFTDGEYALRVAQFPQADSYNILLQTHESLKFSNAMISAEQFQQCQQAYRSIEQALNG